MIYYRHLDYKWWGTQWYNFKVGVKNIWFWLPIIYLDRWWDHVYFYRILRHKLTQMEKGFKHQGMCVNSVRDAKNMKTCILLLDRLINDDYITSESERYNNIRKSFEEEEAMANQDVELLFKILRKQIRSWWD